MLNDYTMEGFLNLISLPNRIIYRRRKTKNIHRAWILIYEHVMLNDALRLAVQNDGIKFWEDDPFFRFRYPVNKYGCGGIPLEFAEVHWLKLFPMWVRLTLHSPWFEVFRTPTMGLGTNRQLDTVT